MFLKKRRFLFSFYFWKQKRLKTTKKKKRSKEEFKKKKSTKNKRDFWWESVSFVFLCYMGLKHNTTMFRTPLKRELLLKRKENYNDKKKKRLTEKWKQLRRRCILPCTLFCCFFLWGSEGAGASPSPWRACSWELAAEPFWSLTHFPPSAPPPFSLCLLLFLGLSLSHSNLSHSQSVSPLFLPVHFVIPNRTLPKE